MNVNQANKQAMNNLAILLFLTFSLYACSTQSGKEDNTSQDTVIPLHLPETNEKDYSPKPLDYAITEIELRDTLQFYLADKECAIVLKADSAWIKEQLKTMPEKRFHDISTSQRYYQSLAIDTLEKLNIPVYYGWDAKRYVKFQKTDNSNIVLDKTKMNDKQGLILFNGRDNPVLWSSTTIVVSLRNVYGRKP
jgi:hypothetical protein